MSVKIGKEAFLYLEPLNSDVEFAQCSTCRDWVMDDDRCRIHGQYVTVPGTASCGFYIEGTPCQPGAHTEAIVTPTDSGLTDREVRCENCYYGGPEIYVCGLFETLNKALPNDFDIDVNITPKGCCNANTPRET